VRPQSISAVIRTIASATSSILRVVSLAGRMTPQQFIKKWKPVALMERDRADALHRSVRGHGEGTFKSTIVVGEGMELSALITVIPVSVIPGRLMRVTVIPLRNSFGQCGTRVLKEEHRTIFEANPERS
jgi:hypothetical protein